MGCLRVGLTSGRRSRTHIQGLRTSKAAPLKCVPALLPRCPEEDGLTAELLEEEDKSSDYLHETLLELAIR